MPAWVDNDIIVPVEEINKLYSEALDGNALAKEKLFERLLVSFRVIVRHRMWGDGDAEDIVQDALTSIASQFDETTINTSFSAWACRILNNKIVDHFRSKKIRADKIRLLEADAGDLPANMPALELSIQIKRCFANIHKTYKSHAEILSLHFQGFSTDEICKRLEITRNNYYVRLSRAREMLERCLNQEDDTHE